MQIHYSVIVIIVRHFSHAQPSAALQVIFGTQYFRLCEGRYIPSRLGVYWSWGEGEYNRSVDWILVYEVELITRLLGTQWYAVVVWQVVWQQRKMLAVDWALPNLELSLVQQKFGSTSNLSQFPIIFQLIEPVFTHTSCSDKQVIFSNWTDLVHI